MLNKENDTYEIVLETLMKAGYGEYEAMELIAGIIDDYLECNKLAEAFHTLYENGIKLDEDLEPKKINDESIKLLH